MKDEYIIWVVLIVTMFYLLSGAYHYVIMMIILGLIWKMSRPEVHENR